MTNAPAALPRRDVRSETCLEQPRANYNPERTLTMGNCLDEAKRQAEAWLAPLAGSAVRRIKRATVPEALGAYLADLRRDCRPDTARAVEEKFKTVV
jgi:hypothetical protein